MVNSEKITEFKNAIISKISSLISTHNASSTAHPDIRSHIAYGQVDNTSTSTVFTATVPNVNQLTNGTTVMLKNGVVTSAEGFTLNVNNLGAKPVYSNLANATRDTTIFNINYTMLFVYDSSRVEDGCWICYRGYDSNTNTIGYQLRTNSTKYVATDKGYRYRLWLQTSDDGKFMPVNLSTSTDATSNRSSKMNSREFIIGGDIRYNATNGTVNANAEMSATTLWQQYTLSLGYSFNNTGSALTLTASKPLYMVAVPTGGGNARLSSPYYTQSLPSSDDGKIYILLGYMYSATSMELVLEHPVFEYRDGSVGLYNPSYTISDVDDLLDSKSDINHTHTVSNITDFPTVPTKTSDLTNDSGYLTSHQDITGKEDKSNKVASWSSTVTDTNYPTEKLVKNSLDNKASSTDLTNGLQNIGGYTIHTVYNVSGTASAFNISEGLIYAQQTPVFFLVKNTIGDNEANATLKYYPNGNNITILDTFSNTSASPIQQGVWKKDTWALFFCTNNDWVQLRCVFYDSVGIDEKLGDLSGDVTSLSSDVTSLSSNITNLDNIERISSTHSPSTTHWTGRSQTLTSLENGTKILYRLTKTPTIDDKVAYLTLTLSNGNTTSEYTVLFKGTSSTALEFSHNSFVQNDVFLLEFKDNVWRIRDFFAIGYRPTVSRTGSYNDLSDKPTIPTVPTNVSAFNNDSGYLTAHQDISGKEDKSNKVTSISSSSTDTQYPSAKAVFDSLPSVPSASSTTPSADTTSGSVGTGTTWARSNHTHPKSSLYAEASHTHSEYVNPTIIDNLTTNDATKVLSAKQGKVLNDMIGDAITYITQ